MPNMINPLKTHIYLNPINPSNTSVGTKHSPLLRSIALHIEIMPLIYNGKMLEKHPWRSVIFSEVEGH